MTTKLEDITKIGRVKADKIRAQGFADVESLPNDEAKLIELGLNPESIVEVLALLNADNGDSEEHSPAAVVETEGEDSATDNETEGDSGDDDQPEVLSNDNDQAQADRSQADSGNVPAASTSAASQSEESQTESETQDVGEIKFRLLSGDHKGREVNWLQGQPAIKFTDGQFISLEAFSVHEMEDDSDEETVEFRFTWGNTVGRGSLSREKFTAFSEEVKKKVARR